MDMVVPIFSYSCVMRLAIRFFLLFMTAQNICAQTNREALDFLNMNVPEWACEKYAHGTGIPRIAFSLLNNESELQIMVKMPEYSSTSGYYSVVIKLAEVKMVEVVETSNSCAYIRIVTEPRGLKVVFMDRQKSIRDLDQNVYAFYERNGLWVDDNIRLRNDVNFVAHANRIKTSIEFLARSNGARIVESQF